VFYSLSEMQLLITCPFGLSSLLSKEIKRLHIPVTDTKDTAVTVETDQQGMYQLHLRSRLANKVYLVLGEAKIETFDQLFNFIVSLPFETYLSTEALSVHVVTKNSQLSAERSIQSVAHKAILTALSKAGNTRT
jgi:putative N6-adenine-specific DNA methylase